MQICTVKLLQGREALQIKRVSVFNRDILCLGQSAEVSELTEHHFTCKPPVSLPIERATLVTSVLTDDQ